MESAFAWLGRIFDAILEFIPRRVIIRDTHRGVKWSLWRGPREMEPGVRIWWPLISDIELIVVARQTHNMVVQSLMTADGKEIVVGGVVIYKINDVVQAIGKNNWQPSDTVNDITQAAIVDVVTRWKLADLLEHVSNDVEKELTLRCRKKLRQYGIYVVRAALTDLSTCRQLNHSGINITVGS